MNFQILPLEMISPPNFYSPAQQWQVSTNATTLWGQLRIQDALGDRRYIPANGSTLEVTFLRMDNISMSTTYPLVVTNTNQNVVKPVVFLNSDTSLFNFTLTNLDVGNVISGSVKFKLTEAGIEKVWTQSYLVKKQVQNLGC